MCDEDSRQGSVVKAGIWLGSCYLLLAARSGGLQRLPMISPGRASPSRAKGSQPTYWQHAQQPADPIAPVPTPRMALVGCRYNLYKIRKTSVEGQLSPILFLLTHEEVDRQMQLYPARKSFRLANKDKRSMFSSVCWSVETLKALGR